MNRFLTLFNRLFALWVVLGGLAAYTWPEFFASLKGYMEWFFGLTMFGVGMVLDPEAFVSIFRRFRVVLIGVAAQFSIMPLSAWPWDTCSGYPTSSGWA